MPSPNPMLAPVVALAAWTAVVWGWMYATRIPAIIGVRYDATELMAGLTEVLCYGTAVVVEVD